MGTDGRGYSDLFRNSSEEMFLKTVMDSSVGMTSPTMEIFGFRNLSQNFRTDSEELFKTWLTNGESPVFGSGTTAHRPRHLSRRILNEHTSLPGRQNGNINSSKGTCNISPQHLQEQDISGDVNHHHHQLRNVTEKGLQASNLYLAKAWFHSSQPMTRSRSSELRRRYVAMQNTQTHIGMEAAQNPSAQSVMKQELSNPNDFSELPSHEMQDQFSPPLMAHSNSYNNFNNAQYGNGNVDQVSSLVSLLKGTLENKKHVNNFDTQVLDDDASGCFHFAQNYLNQFHESRGAAGYSEANDLVGIQAAEGQYDVGLESSFISPSNQMHICSQVPCQSESSAAAPVASSRFDACDGPSNSGQTICVSDSSRKEVGKSTSHENALKAKGITELSDFREHIYENSKENKKRGSLVRYGSVTSTVSADPTKKRRVERSRKMAEAKERSSTPAIPLDMQSILKRCENLEKEVRSLKLNLSFMNRKDSEQTKQIEELQVQNEELGEEKERLLEEIERIISDTGRK